MKTKREAKSVIGRSFEDDHTAFGKIAIACLILVLGLVSSGYGDVIIGNWENQMDAWAAVDATAADPCEGVGNTLNNYSLKVAVPSGWHVAVIRESGLLPDITTATTIKVDITLKASEWEIGSGWVKAIENIVLQDDMSSWQQLSPVGGDSAVGWDGSGDATITATFEVPVQTGPFSWASLIIVTNYDGVTTPGNFYFDNVRIVTPDMIITKCKVKAGKVVDGNQGNDAIDISGTAAFPADLDDINLVNVSITSVTDDELIYSEDIDFNATVANETGKLEYSYKIPRGEEGAITSLKFDFVKGTFAIKAKNVDLTGLASPIQLDITMGDYVLSGEAEEDVINNSRKTIPTRLMRTYQDTLIVTKAKVKASDEAASDSLSVKGDIAAIDVDDANLVEAGLVIYWADQEETTPQTITVPAEYFVPARSGNVYKCSKAPADEGGLVSGKFDLDKSTFTLSVKQADLGVTTGDVKFGLTISAFDEVDDVNLVLGH